MMKIIEFINHGIKLIMFITVDAIHRNKIYFSWTLVLGLIFLFPSTARAIAPDNNKPAIFPKQYPLEGRVIFESLVNKTLETYAISDDQISAKLLIYLAANQDLVGRLNPAHDLKLTYQAGVSSGQANNQKIYVQFVQLANGNPIEGTYANYVLSRSYQSTKLISVKLRVYPELATPVITVSLSAYDPVQAAQTALGLAPGQCDTYDLREETQYREGKWRGVFVIVCEDYEHTRVIMDRGNGIQAH
jgi:hypothetical protein